MKKIKFILASATVLTVSASLFSFASANDISKENTKAVVKSTQANISQEAEAGWIAAWSSNYAGLLGWE